MREDPDDQRGSDDNGDSEQDVTDDEEVDGDEQEAEISHFGNMKRKTKSKQTMATKRAKMAKIAAEQDMVDLELVGPSRAPFTRKGEQLYQELGPYQRHQLADTLQTLFDQLSHAYPHLSTIHRVTGPHHQKEYSQVLEYVAKDELETFSNLVGLNKGQVLAIAKHIVNAIIQIDPQESLPEIDDDITGDLTASVTALINDMKTDMKSLLAIVTINQLVSRILMTDARHSRVETAKTYGHATTGWAARKRWKHYRTLPNNSTASDFVTLLVVDLKSYL
ncbi:hypothetical protein DM01DRAFT_1375540 [Hesseltinella vesiculosa]|uniref:Uncharacterized protein n=1 Tax=Hesseltinella vesiculosa TaxID=101127 RepID=A0A1X2GDL1_9FUNG|nr:hypothetical protein DM01DRAFT_1375540 [Hesseltinella vesiculosa]